MANWVGVTMAKVHGLFGRRRISYSCR